MAKKSVGKFGYVTMDCGINAWSNDHTEKGRIELQNNLKGKAITESNILSVFRNTKFMEIGGIGNGKVPALVEMIQFFPKDGKAKVGAYYCVRDGKKYGSTINLKWEVPKSENDYDKLLEKYNALENRIAILEKLLAK